MSGTDELTLVDAGRMISALRSIQRSKVSGWYHRTYSRRYSDKQIQDTLGLDKEFFDKAIKAYDAQKPVWRSEEEIVEIVRKWIIKNKRWPKRKDFDDKSIGVSYDAFHRTVGGIRALQELLVGPPTRNVSWLARSAQIDQLRSQLTPGLILSVRNVTTRRSLMEQYGIEKLLRDGGGKVVQQDDYGTLWELPTDNHVDNRVLYLEVVNSTPEPDGTFAHYFLRVPPAMGSAKEAVEWTFGDLVEMGIEINVVAAT